MDLTSNDETVWLRVIRFYFNVVSSNVGRVLSKGSPNKSEGQKSKYNTNVIFRSPLYFNYLVFSGVGIPQLNDADKS